MRHRGTLSSRIAVEIERLISERQLRPGDRLPPERELANLFSVSRPSLREAVKSLEAVGRLRVQHGTGSWVAEPNAQRKVADSRQMTLAELFAMREVLEVPAAGWAAKVATTEGVADLKRLLEHMSRIDDVTELGHLDTAFHIRIAELAANRFLLQTVGILHDLLEEGMATTLTIPGRREVSRSQHLRIVDAIARGDEAEAKSAIRAHIRSAQVAGLRRLAAEGLRGH
jgi:GntR family transcriptional repressor for pyruvate dehydrogenase complex